MPGRPHHTEKMKSCVEKVTASGKDESSAYAICTASLQDAGEAIFEGAESRSAEEYRLLGDVPGHEFHGNQGTRHLHLLGATGLARKIVEAGKEWLVIPVVALMEGVIHAVNAATPEFVPLTTLQKAAASWNGKPVTLGHPKRDGKQCSAGAPDILEAHGIGVIKNSRVEGTKLLQDVWIDRERAKKLHPQMLARLEANKTEEVSVGAFVVTDGKGDAFNGKPYLASWIDAAGDHLAFLPGGRGACSVAMGCGTHRAAMRACEDTLEPVAPEAEFAGALLRSLLPRGWGDDEVKQDLRDALYRIDPMARNGEILRVTNNEIVYCVYPPPAQPMSYYDPYPAPAKMTYWKRSYSYEPSTKSFEISPDKAQVEPTTVYETLAAMKGKPAYKDCPTCEGLGSVGGNPCPTCDGSGEVMMKAASACGCGGHEGACACGNKEQPEQSIKHEGGRYVLYSQDGRHRLAEHGTLQDAETHRRAIQSVLASRRRAS